MQPLGNDQKEMYMENTNLARQISDEPETIRKRNSFLFNEFGERISNSEESRYMSVQQLDHWQASGIPEIPPYDPEKNCLKKHGHDQNGSNHSSTPTKSRGKSNIYQASPSLKQQFRDLNNNEVHVNNLTAELASSSKPVSRKASNRSNKSSRIPSKEENRDLEYDSLSTSTASAGSKKRNSLISIPKSIKKLTNDTLKKISAPTSPKA